MRWKHLFTAWKDAQNPIGLPRKNEAETAATSQRHNYVAMNTVYPTWNPVSTASQEEPQIPADIDGAAVQEAAANLRQELEHLKQATAELHSTFLEMQERRWQRRTAGSSRISTALRRKCWRRAGKEKMSHDLRSVRPARLL